MPNSETRVPLICAHPSTVVGAEIFNPNLWTDNSTSIIRSCWSEYSVLHHCLGQIDVMCDNSEEFCHTHIETLQQHWTKAKFDLSRIVVFGESPDLHMRIEAFFSGVKSLLDLLVQLLGSERIISGFVDGFHRDKEIYGGRTLNALHNNASANHKITARKLASLIGQHKKIWIDGAISTRDHLTHPRGGMPQLMFRLDCVDRDNKLVCVEIKPPEVDGVTINEYGRRVFACATDFSCAFLTLVRQATASGDCVEPTC